MAKEVDGFIKLQVRGGAANPAPPVGPALGAKGVNIMEFCKRFNAKTEDSRGKLLPVVITVFKDKSFEFVIKTAPAAYQLLEATKLKKGSPESNRQKIGSVTWDQVKAIAAGQGDIAIVNSYYIGLLLSSEKEEEINAGNAVSVFFPNQGENDRGAHINVSGIALTKNAPNKENAIELIKYLTSIEGQETYVNNSYEYSVNPNVKPDQIVQAWGEFKKDPVDLNMLGIKRDEAIRIFDKTGWK